MIEDATYREPDEFKPCMLCKHIVPFQKVMCCGYNPSPKGLPEDKKVDAWGSCEYWEERLGE